MKAFICLPLLTIMSALCLCPHAKAGEANPILRAMNSARASVTKFQKASTATAKVKCSPSFRESSALRNDFCSDVLEGHNDEIAGLSATIADLDGFEVCRVDETEVSYRISFCAEGEESDGEAEVVDYTHSFSVDVNKATFMARLPFTSNRSIASAMSSCEIRKSIQDHLAATSDTCGNKFGSEGNDQVSANLVRSGIVMKLTATSRDAYDRAYTVKVQNAKRAEDKRLAAEEYTRRADAFNANKNRARTVEGEICAFDPELYAGSGELSQTIDAVEKNGRIFAKLAGVSCITPSNRKVVKKTIVCQVAPTNAAQLRNLISAKVEMLAKNCAEDKSYLAQLGNIVTLRSPRKACLQDLASRGALPSGGAMNLFKIYALVSGLASSERKRFDQMSSARAIDIAIRSAYEDEAIARVVGSCKSL